MLDDYWIQNLPIVRQIEFYFIHNQFHETRFWQLYAEPAVNGDPSEPFWHCYSGDYAPILCHEYLGKYGKMVPHAQKVKDIAKVESGTVKPVEPVVPPLPGMTKKQKTPKDDQNMDDAFGGEEDFEEQGEEETEEYDQEDGNNDEHDDDKDHLYYSHSNLKSASFQTQCRFKLTPNILN